MSMDNATVNSRMVVILVIIVGLISGVGVIISAVALGRPSQPNISITQTANNKPLLADWLSQQATNNPTSATPTPTTTAQSRSARDIHQFIQYAPGLLDHQVKTVWTVAVGYDDGPHEYRDEAGGIQGFSADIVNAVCSTLGIDCRIIYDKSENCWTTTPSHIPSGGQGLLGHWYDACIGWMPTHDRLNVFDFSSVYAKPSLAKIIVKSGDVMKLSDLKNKAVGFVRGFAEDEMCLTHQNSWSALPQEFVKYADTPEEAVDMLRQGKVSSVFGNHDNLMPHLGDDLEDLDDTSYSCGEDGYAVMTRKDSTFLSLWNKGFQSIKENGLYKTLCQEAAKHADRGAVFCMED